MEYLCNTNVVIDKNVILIIENIGHDKFKEKGNNNLMLNDHSKLRTYRFLKNEYDKEENYLLKNIPLKIETGRY